MIPECTTDSEKGVGQDQSRSSTIKVAKFSILTRRYVGCILCESDVVPLTVG